MCKIQINYIGTLRIFLVTIEQNKTYSNLSYNFHRNKTASNK